MKLKYIFPIILLTFITATQQLLSVPVKSNHVEAELVSDVLSLKPGSTFRIAVRLKMDNHWHTYWRNPGGEIGLPTKITWQLPQGFEAGKINWPYPKRFEDRLLPDEPPLVSYGYTEEIFLSSDITAPQGLDPGQEIEFLAKVKWLACKEMCIPGSADLKLKFPVSNESPKLNITWAEKLSQSQVELPLQIHEWDIQAIINEKKIEVLLIPPENIVENYSKILFIPHHAGIINDIAEQIVVNDETGGATGFQLNCQEKTKKLWTGFRAY